ncbi:hypothetical protein DNTS_026973, partial [Danionella cerebrum]
QEQRERVQSGWVNLGSELRLVAPRARKRSDRSTEARRNAAHLNIHVLGPQQQQPKPLKTLPLHPNTEAPVNPHWANPHYPNTERWDTGLYQQPSRPRHLCIPTASSAHTDAK